MHALRLDRLRALRGRRESRANAVVRLAVKTFGAVRYAQAWLGAPHHELAGSRPCEMLGDAAGVRHVAALLRAKRFADAFVVDAVSRRLGDEGAAAWLSAPNATLSGHAPIDVLREPEGPDVVMWALGQPAESTCSGSP